MNKKDIDVIDYIIKTPNGLTLTQLIDLTKLPKATLYHKLEKLVNLQVLHKNKSLYFLGSVILRWMNERQGKREFIKLLHSYLVEIAETTKQTVHLVQLRGASAVYIDKIEYDSAIIQIKSYVGKELSLYSTGSGRAILSLFSDAALDAYFSTQCIVPKTAKTTTDIATLKKIVAESRKRGYAVEVGEDVDEIQCVGICFHWGGEILAISVSTILLIDFEELTRMGEYLLKMKNKIVAELNI